MEAISTRTNYKKIHCVGVFTLDLRAWVLGTSKIHQWSWDLRSLFKVVTRHHDRRCTVMGYTLEILDHLSGTYFADVLSCEHVVRPSRVGATGQVVREGPRYRSVIGLPGRGPWTRGLDTGLSHMKRKEQVQFLFMQVCRREHRQIDLHGILTNTLNCHTVRK
jgi:hypothetical protein